MLSCFVNLPTNFEVRPPANPFLSAACTLPFSIFPQHADSKPLPHSFKNIGGYAPFVPFWNPHRAKFHSRPILIKTTPLPATKLPSARTAAMVFKPFGSNDIHRVPLLAATP